MLHIFERDEAVNQEIAENSVVGVARFIYVVLRVRGRTALYLIY